MHLKCRQTDGVGHIPHFILVRDVTSFRAARNTYRAIFPCFAGTFCPALLLQPLWRAGHTGASALPARLLGQRHAHALQRALLRPDPRWITALRPRAPSALLPQADFRLAYADAESALFFSHRGAQIRAAPVDGGWYRAGS